MKIMFWDSDEPKDRITLSVILLIPVTLLARTIVVSSSRVRNVELGDINPVALKGQTYYLTDIALYSVYLLITLVCVSIGVIAINAAIIAVRWFRQHNAR